jgi:hypothetical protein
VVEALRDESFRHLFKDLFWVLLILQKCMPQKFIIPAKKMFESLAASIWLWYYALKVTILSLENNPFQTPPSRLV